MNCPVSPIVADIFLEDIEEKKAGVQAAPDSKRSPLPIDIRKFNGLVNEWPTSKIGMGLFLNKVPFLGRGGE